jgi:exonuclease III
MNNELEGITFSSINVNSLNMASINKPAQMRKIYGILKLKSDFIMLSDVRISNRNMASSYQELVSIFRNNQYGSYSTFFNSTKNKRGVGILINNSLTFSELARRDDPEENYLLLRIRIRGTTVIIGLVYGPNNYDNDFFNRLHHDIVSLGNYPVILAGDWNATYSSLPVEANPDCLTLLRVAGGMLAHPFFQAVPIKNVRLLKSEKNIYSSENVSTTICL